MRVHGVVQRPRHVTGAVDTCVVILVPLLVGIVAVSRVGAVLIGIAGVLRLEEVDPTLGQADGGSLLAGAHVLPIPSTAVDVQAGTHRLQRRGNEVFQGSLTGGAAHRRGVVRRNRRKIDGLCRVAVPNNLHGIAPGCRCRGDGSSASLRLNAIGQRGGG